MNATSCEFMGSRAFGKGRWDTNNVSATVVAHERLPLPLVIAPSEAACHGER